jgi:excisionase family DNA binding protein
MTMVFGSRVKIADTTGPSLANKELRELGIGQLSASNTRDRRQMLHVRLCFLIIRLFRFILGGYLNQYLEDIMPTAATLGKTPGHRYDPLGPLADAIGSMTGTLSAQVANALHQVLEATTPQSRSARLQLIRHLVDIESRSVGIEMPKSAAVANDLISTAQAAELLGYSRPYVAMLIDQNKLKGATVSAGGHRRVSRAAVLDWKAKQQVTGKATDLRTEGQKAGVYKSTEADVVRRVKALSKIR